MQILLPGLCGAAIGWALKVLCDRLEGLLLRRRGLSFEQSPAESAALTAAMAVFGAAIAILVPFSAETLYMFLLLAAAELTAATDTRYRIIPNDVILALFIVRLGFGLPSLFGAKGLPVFHWQWSLVGMAVCFIIFLLPALQKKNVGAGDLKLAAAMGFCLELKGGLFAIVLMGLFVLGYTLMQRRVPALKFMKSLVPMGPFLSAGMVAVLLLQKIELFAAILSM